MNQSQAIEKLRAALAKEAERPPAERFQDMVRRGVIDAEGHVRLTVPGHEAQPTATPSPRKPRRQKAR